MKTKPEPDTFYIVPLIVIAGAFFNAAILLLWMVG